MNKQDILQGVLDYFNGDTLAANVWIDKYALKDSSGDIKEKTPEDMHRRLAKEFARIESKYPNPISEKYIFELIDRFKYVVPQGSPMFGIGNDFSITSLSNCFVIGSAIDSYGGIMHTDEEQIQLMKRRGGVGHDLSNLRPAGALANNAALNEMAGAVSYAQRFSNSTKEVRQGDRRGALMLSISIKHPDAEKFIDSKLESGKITDANISVRVTDEFMKAVEEDEDFIQMFPVDLNWEDHVGFYVSLISGNIEYDKLYSLDNVVDWKGCYAKRVKAKRIWDKIIKNAWKSAEPGVLFWNSIIRESPADCYGEEWQTKSTNPCGEIPLCPYDSCRLLSINLYSYVVNALEKDAYFDFDLFKEHVIVAQRLMDDLVDLELEKINKILEKIENDPEDDSIKSVEKELWEKIFYMTQAGRRTGLGVTGEGDMLAALGFTYGSDLAIDMSERVHRELAVSSYTSSIIMAEERGSFIKWDYELEKENPFINRIYNELEDYKYKEMYYNYGRRNISNLTIAPTGTTSLMTQTTSGIEPCFAVFYKRRRRTIDKSKASFIDEHGEMFEEYNVFHHKFEEWYDKNWFKTDVKLFDLDYKKPLENYTDEELKELITKSPYHNATSSDINWTNKVKLQGRVQRWVDHSISATTNIPESTPINVVSDIYMTAYKSGCKGMTIYREGSRSGILVSDKKKSFDYMDAIKRPKEVDCDIYHKIALKRNWMILVGKYEGKPYEIFAFPEVPNHIFPYKIQKGTISKVKSRVYKLVGFDQEFDKKYEIANIIDLIENEDQVGTRKYSMMLRHRIDPKYIVSEIEQYSLVTSFDKVVQRVLRNYIDGDGSLCPQCGLELTHEDGCLKCNNCGFSKCG